jgi:hypothetical protein
MALRTSDAVGLGSSCPLVAHSGLSLHSLMRQTASHKSFLLLLDGATVWEGEL